MMEETLLTVGVLVHQSQSYLEAFFESLSGQTLTGVELLVGDNNLESSEDRIWIKEHWPDAKVSVFGNVGFAKGHNRLVGQAKGKYYACLNPDLVLEPDYFRKVIDALESDESIGSVQGSILRFDRKTVDSLGLKLRAWGQAENVAEGNNGQSSMIDDQLQEVWGVTGAAGVYRRAVFLEVGGFDEEMFMYKEDVDLAYRLQKEGYRAVRVPDAICYHDRTADAGDRKHRSLRERQWSYRHHRLFLRKIWSDLRWWEKGLALGYEGLKWAYLRVFESEVVR